jgi:hypothetical protein
VKLSSPLEIDFNVVYYDVWLEVYLQVISQVEGEPEYYVAISTSYKPQINELNGIVTIYSLSTRAYSEMGDFANVCRISKLHKSLLELQHDRR